MAEPADQYDGAREPRWSQVWQMPALVLGLLMFAVGVYLALPEREVIDFGQVLDEVSQYLKAENLEKAQEALESQLGPFLEQAPGLERARYELYWGDLVYQQQRQKNWDLPENHLKTLNHYQSAKDLGLTLDPLHLQRLAETLVALNREEDAVKVLDALGEGEVRRRYLVLRQIIERRLTAGSSRVDVMPLVARFELELSSEPSQRDRRPQELWAAGVRTRAFLEAGTAEEAIKYLQRRMIVLMDEGGEGDLGPLQVLLAQAYQSAGDYRQAQRWYRLAQQKLDVNDDTNAQVLVGLAQVELAETGDVRAALEGFAAAEEQYPAAATHLEALIGRADCEARLGVHPEAVEHFGRAVAAVAGAQPRDAQRVKLLASAIRSHYEFNLTHEDYDVALEYLNLVRPLYEPDYPADLQIELASTHERIGELRLREAWGGEAPADPEAARGKQVDPAAKMRFQEAAVHFGEAAGYYMRHAEQTMGTDEQAFADSLWNSARCYDRAQMWDKAIEVYAEFVRSRPQDPRQLEAMRLLGMAYQSIGQHETAVELFTELIEGNGRSPEAYASLVPLAQCRESMGDFENAERVLLHVVTDHPAITPESVQYELALIELGKLYHQLGRYEEAIGRLSEAVQRYGQAAQGAQLRFRLADAYRLSVEQIDKDLLEPMPQPKQAALKRERARRLEEAQALFAAAIGELEAKPESARTALEKLFLRNAYFYRADCVYDLGRYEQAIDLYDLAARRWENDPASLVALVQIVNAYCELGRPQEAKIANDRARWQLKRIPEEAFDDPSLPMTREHWQEWLRWSSELDLFGSQASARPAPAGAGAP
jgi:tetratricopeptide (TPR) repeat protein